jgi:RNA polymerase sigma factor (sigma-70 family)
MTTLPHSIFDDGSRLPRTNFRQRREVTPTGGGVGATRPIAAPATVVEPKSDRTRRRAEDAALVTELLSDEIDFMDHPDFHKAGAERRIYQEAPPVPRPTVGWYRPMMDDIGTTSPRRHEGIVLTAAQERVIFMQFNYARFRMRKIQKALRGRVPNAEESKDLLRWHRTATGYREQIAETNLALVLAMAKRVRLGEGEFADLIGEGNMALMRSVDKFDCGRGFKFSTYASWAIIKNFSRSVPDEMQRRERFVTGQDEVLMLSPDARTDEQSILSRQELVAESVHTLLGKLDPREREIIRLRAGIDNPQLTRERGMTLEEIGQRFGITKERVRQLHARSMRKLRHLATEQALDMP